MNSENVKHEILRVTMRSWQYLWKTNSRLGLLHSLYGLFFKTCIYVNHPRTLQDLKAKFRTVIANIPADILVDVKTRHFLLFSQ